MGKPAKRYWPAVSVRALRLNPVLWLAIATLTPGTTAPLGSVTVPETVASWVWDQAVIERSATKATDARALPMINSLCVFGIDTLNLEQTAHRSSCSRRRKSCGNNRCYRFNAARGITECTLNM